MGLLRTSKNVTKRSKIHNFQELILKNQIGWKWIEISSNYKTAWLWNFKKKKDKNLVVRFDCNIQRSIVTLVACQKRHVWPIKANFSAFQAEINIINMTQSNWNLQKQMEKRLMLTVNDDEKDSKSKSSRNGLSKWAPNRWNLHIEMIQREGKSMLCFFFYVFLFLNGEKWAVILNCQLVSECLIKWQPAPCY